MFLPLISAFLCFIFSNFSRFLYPAILVFLLLISLIIESKIFKIPQIEFDLSQSAFSILTEFSINKINLLLIASILLIKLANFCYFFYRNDIKKNYDDKFIILNFINLFALISILITDKILNLLIFLEIFSLSCISIIYIKKYHKDYNRTLFFNSFSMILLTICFFSLLTFAEFSEISLLKNIKNDFASNFKFFFTINFYLILLACLAKFIGIWIKKDFFSSFLKKENFLLNEIFLSNLICFFYIIFTFKQLVI
jgi:formate hydrogenlyase subunit 3/multisubunit Na+/H+ antiporter MnhD subunit